MKYTDNLLDLKKISGTLHIHKGLLWYLGFNKVLYKFILFIYYSLWGNSKFVGLLVI